MAVTYSRGDVFYADVPFNEAPENRKRRPVVVLGASPMNREEDQVVLVAQITSFGGGGHALGGDVPILNWRNLGFTKESWIRARRLWGANPSALSPYSANPPRVDDFTLTKVLNEISDLLL